MDEYLDASILSDRADAKRLEDEVRDMMQFCCQRGNSLIMPKTRPLIFIHITKYLSPGTSYDRQVAAE